MSKEISPADIHTPFLAKTIRGKKRQSLTRKLINFLRFMIDSHFQLKIQKRFLLSVCFDRHVFYLNKWPTWECKIYFKDKNGMKQMCETKLRFLKMLIVFLSRLAFYSIPTLEQGGGDLNTGYEIKPQGGPLENRSLS